MTSPFPNDVLAAAGEVINMLTARGLMMVTIESCTGGLVAAALTSIAGSSTAVHGGYVTYANSAKVRMVGVSEHTLGTHGAVSEAVARDMADGGRRHSGADIAVSITGIAGPGGGTAEKPVGLVHFAAASAQKTIHSYANFGNLGRDQVRMQSVHRALQLTLELLAVD